MTRILIVGSGFSGTMTAIHVVRYAQTKIEITLVDKSGKFGPGSPYSGKRLEHILNVPAAGMSAFNDQPNHFVDWISSRPDLWPRECKSEHIRSFYFPRYIYGIYLNELLENVQQNAGDHISLRRIAAEALDAAVLPNGQIEVQLSNGEMMRADKMVLGLGNLPPKRSTRAVDQKYLFGIWDQHEIEQIGANDTVLIIGTGLTMVDTVLSLKHRHHVAKVFAVSRHGLLPHPHAPFADQPPAPFFENKPLPQSARELLRTVRYAVRNYQGPWQRIVDSVRSSTPQFWQHLPLADRRRLLRHMRAHWISLGNKVPQPIFETLQSMQRKDQLSILAGRIQRLYKREEIFEVGIKLRGTTNQLELRPNWIIDCTGPETNFENVESTLLRNMIQKGMIAADDLGLGLACDETGAAFDKSGRLSSNTFFIGLLRRGKLWESTAVPQLRVQAERLGRDILQLCNQPTNT